MCGRVIIHTNKVCWSDGATLQIPQPSCGYVATTQFAQIIIFFFIEMAPVDKVVAEFSHDSIVSNSFI